MKRLYTYAEGGAKSISDGNGDAAGKGTTITCAGYSLESQQQLDRQQQQQLDGVHGQVRLVQLAQLLAQ